MNAPKKLFLLAVSLCTLIGAILLLAKHHDQPTSIAVTLFWAGVFGATAILRAPRQ